MFDFADTRSMVFHPETAYWVSYDIDVPLFLPVYGLNRIRDLRYIAAREASSGKRIKGQMMFDSGWEFGSVTSEHSPHGHANASAFRATTAVVVLSPRHQRS